MKPALLVAVFVLAAVPARTQNADTRWEPWLGCWELAVDNLRDAGVSDGTLPRASRPSAVRDGAPRVCVSRVAEGARFETTVGGQSAIDQTIVADAVSHTLNDAECTGTQRAEWSKNGLRLYSSAELQCRGDDGPRRVSGISLIASNGNWIDIQSVAVGGRQTIRAKRYFRAADSPRSGRPSVVSSVLTLEEIKEAVTKVAPAAVEEALIQTNAGYNLTGRQLIDLADAGVPDRVIDLLVALSYPDRFIVQRVDRGGSSVAQTVVVRDPFFAGWAFGYPYYYDDYYLSPYYYEPFAYRGRILAGYYYDGVYVGGAPIEAQPSGLGRVVDGRGYTRIQPRETAASDNSTSSAPTASRRSAEPVSSASSAGASSAPSSSSSSSGSSGGGTASSSGGYSQGGSSGSGGSGGSGE